MKHIECEDTGMHEMADGRDGQQEQRKLQGRRDEEAEGKRH